MTAHKPPMPWLFSRGAKHTLEDRRVDYVSLRRPLVALFVAVSTLGLGVSAYASGAHTVSPAPVKAEAQFVQKLSVGDQRRADGAFTPPPSDRACLEARGRPARP